MARNEHAAFASAIADIAFTEGYTRAAVKGIVLMLENGVPKEKILEVFGEPEYKQAVRLFRKRVVE